MSVPFNIGFYIYIQNSLNLKIMFISVMHPLICCALRVLSMVFSYILLLEKLQNLNHVLHDAVEFSIIYGA